MRCHDPEAKKPGRFQMKLMVIIFLVLTTPALAQHIGPSLPKEIRKTGSYLFYLHGGVVTVLGNNALNRSRPEWGPYQYLSILDSLRARGFNVISENRREGVEDSVYANKIVSQIDTLLSAGVKPRNMLVLGASAGAHIAILVSAKLKNKKMKYVIMGGCWANTYKDYVDITLYGHFLSVIEATDPHGTCFKIFEKRKFVKSYQEIKLNTGLSHGFIYKGHKEWIDPVVKWYKSK
jgi:hypothetical protein